MSEQQPTIKLRIDVDYPYPSSRAKSFLCIALGLKSKKSKYYLKNARVIAKMINESPKKVMAYWFFTPFTIPDKKLLDLLNPQRHEVGLHIATNAVKEWRTLEKETGRKIKYYTFHGTSSLIAQILWRRRIGQEQASVPHDLPLKSFHDFTTTSLDRRVYEAPVTIKEELERLVRQGTVISIHPEWLFVRNRKSHRGPFYDALKTILDVG